MVVTLDQGQWEGWVASARSPGDCGYDYRANKAKAVEWASTFVANNGGAFAPGVADLFCRGGKQDDLADALLLVMYYLDTYSNQLSCT